MKAILTMPLPDASAPASGATNAVTFHTLAVNGFEVF